MFRILTVLLLAAILSGCGHDYITRPREPVVPCPADTVVVDDDGEDDDD